MSNQTGQQQGQPKGQSIRPSEQGDVPDDPLARVRHSASHVTADAVPRIQLGARVAVGPSIETGFCFDCDTEPFEPGDIGLVEADVRLRPIDEFARRLAEEAVPPAPTGATDRSTNVLHLSQAGVLSSARTRQLPLAGHRA